MAFKVVIPARRHSTRLPDKVLLPIAGLPMLAHVCDRAQQSRADTVVVATDDHNIAAIAETAGATVAMTRSDHSCGTDRIAQAAADNNWPDDAIVVNVQADEPLMPPALIDQVAAALAAAPDAAIATACTPITDAVELADPNVVKVVCTPQGQALYFSRAAIPYCRDNANAEPATGAARHLGIYAYRVGALKRFAAAAPGMLEQTESLEQLRAYELDMAIQVAVAEHIPGPGVDTAADLLAVERRLQTIATSNTTPNTSP